ncbi:endonuclease domain-containing protein [uncultured Gelidibacter sp.]|uniref:endonuclease domain-containing protein n=1 Tax=uncultured Gelidibacter sp. TaxID=259318 RepID=UPI002603A0C8|nr:endonuclease domain-containing protein [uncultured Gelidibacter sp.]
MANKIIPYRSDLRERSRCLRNNATQSEVLLWKKIKNKAYSVQFHRQVPMLDYIVDFYCHEIGLAIEIDGGSHDHKFLYDAKRQGRLEDQGVRFVRFSDKEIKQDMMNVLLVLEHEINELLSE